MSLSLVSGKLTFLHDSYIAAIENCCVPMVVKCTLFATHVALLLLGALFNAIFGCMLFHGRERNQCRIFRKILKHGMIVSRTTTSTATELCSARVL